VHRNHLDKNIILPACHVCAPPWDSGRWWRAGTSRGSRHCFCPPGWSRKCGCLRRFTVPTGWEHFCYKYWPQLQLFHGLALVASVKFHLGNKPLRFSSLCAARKSYHPALRLGFFLVCWVFLAVTKPWFAGAGACAHPAAAERTHNFRLFQDAALLDFQVPAIGRLNSCAGPDTTWTLRGGQIRWLKKSVRIL